MNKIDVIVLVVFPEKIVRWHSQRLASRTIVEFWVSIAKKIGARIQILEAEPESIVDHHRVLRKADLFVFNWNGPIFLKTVRQILGIPTPAIIYLAGEGSRGFAYSIERMGSITDRDLFICVSSAEQKTLQLCYPLARSVVLPYSNLFESHTTQLQIIGGRNERTRLLYVGRYSEQKNLHTLLWSIRILLDINPQINISVDLYGFEDGLGSPNMRQKYSEYFSYLKTLSQILGLNSVVRWHGFMKNKVLKEVVQASPHILVSPSLYSEECFGLAPFDSLARGSLAVLTAWGGHLDLKRYFRGQLKTVQVYPSVLGPYVCAFEFAKAIYEQILKFKKTRVFHSNLPEFYSEKSIQTCLAHFLLKRFSTRTKSKTLVGTEWLSEVHSQIARLNPDLRKNLMNLELQIFKDYTDPLILHPFICYGMKRKARTLSLGSRNSKISDCWIAPWVRIDRHKIVVQDPHRGSYQVRREGMKGEYEVNRYRAFRVKLSQLEVKWLFENGYLVTF